MFKPSEDGISVSVEPASDEKPLELLERILEELGEFAAKSGYRVNFVLDEFQEITRLKESAQIGEEANSWERYAPFQGNCPRILSF